MKKTYDLVIFDLDGTLADTSPGILNSIRYVQQKMRLPAITKEQMYSHVGPPMEESYRRNFGLEGEELRRAVELHKEYAVKQGYREIEVYPGIPQLLGRLHEEGVKTAVATLKAQATAEKIFAEFGLSRMFDLVLGTDASAPKTKAQLLEECIAKLQCTKARTVLIGDSKYDAEGALQAGIDFIAVTYGFGFKSAADAAVYSPTVVCDTVREMENFLHDSD